MYPTMWDTDLHASAALTLSYFSVPILVTVMILCIHLHMGRIISFTSSKNRFVLYISFIDFMIYFTDFMLFLCPDIGYSHILQRLIYGQDRFSSIIHI